MNSINAFRLQGCKSLDGILKVLHGIQGLAAIHQFQHRQSLFSKFETMLGVYKKVCT